MSPIEEVIDLLIELGVRKKYEVVCKGGPDFGMFVSQLHTFKSFSEVRINVRGIILCAEWLMNTTQNWNVNVLHSLDTPYIISNKEMVPKDVFDIIKKKIYQLQGYDQSIRNTQKQILTFLLCNKYARFFPKEIAAFISKEMWKKRYGFPVCLPVFF